MSRRGSAKPPLVIDVRSYSDKDAKTTYLVETSYEQANTTARGAAAVEQRFSAFQDLHAAITEPLNLGAFPVARVWYATDAVKKERVDRLHEYLAVVAEKAGTTPPADLLAFLGVDAASFAAGGGGATPGAARVLGRELPPLVWEVVWEEADAPPPNALAAAMARAALRERASGEKLGAVDEAPIAGDGRSAEAPPPHPYADVNAIMAADMAATAERAAAAADAEAPVATGGGGAADADAAAAAPPPSPGYRVGQRILSEADGGEWRPGRIIGRRVVGGAPQLKVSVDGYDSDQDAWVDAASDRVRALSSVASHNDEGASPGRPRGESAADARREQIRLGAEAAAAAAAASSAAAAATPMAASAGTPATAAPPTPQRVVELEKVNAQLLARIAELERATRLEVAALEKRAAAIAAPAAAADGEADALRMKVSELQTALKAKEASTFAAQGAVRRLGKAEEKAKMRVVSLALQQPRYAALLSAVLRWRAAAAGGVSTPGR